MLFACLPTIQHPDVHVRPIEAADIEVWARYLGDPRVYEHTSWNPESSADLERYVWSAQAHSADSLLRLAVASNQTDQLVGTFGFHTVSSAHRSAELSYDLAPTHWGRGIATAGACGFTRWAHESASVTRVQATVLDSNAKSQAVLERAGFVREGLLRSYRQVRGRPGDFWMYSHIEVHSH